MATHDYTNDLTPQQSANTYVTASSNYSGMEPYEAFDHVDASGTNIFDNCWMSAGSPTVWIQYDFTASYTVNLTSIRITCDSNTSHGRTPKDFKVQGSNDNTNYTDLLTKTGETSWSNVETRTYNISHANNYRYIRLSVSAVNGGGYVAIGELELFGTKSSAGWPHKINGISTPAYVNGVAGSAIAKVMGV